MTESWPILPDEADDIPDDIALRVGKAALVKALLDRKMLRSLGEFGHKSQEFLDYASAKDTAEEVYHATRQMALEALDDGR